MFSLEMIIIIQINTAKTCYIIISRPSKEQMKRKRARPAISISKILTGLFLKGSPTNNMTSTSDAVINTAAQSGTFGNSMTIAIADPSISARSVQIIAISADT
jgi:hypothetical protein